MTDLNTKEEKCEYTLKFILVGDSNVGKSSVLNQLTTKSLKDDQRHTIGIEFGSYVMKGVKNSDHVCDVSLQIWDSAGAERFRAVTRNYYRGCCGCLLVFDLTSKSSFEHLTSWLTDIRSMANQNLAIILLGNKLDLCENNREVSTEEAKNFANSNNLPYFEVSAKDGTNVYNSFLHLSQVILSLIDKGVIDTDQVDSGVDKSGSLFDSPKNKFPKKGGSKSSTSKSGGCCKN